MTKHCKLTTSALGGSYRKDDKQKKKLNIMKKGRNGDNFKFSAIGNKGEL